jgi:hypothetical protein
MALPAAANSFVISVQVRVLAFGDQSELHQGRPPRSFRVRVSYFDCLTLASYALVCSASGPTTAFFVIPDLSGRAWSVSSTMGSFASLRGRAQIRGTGVRRGGLEAPFHFICTFRTYTLRHGLESLRTMRPHQPKAEFSQGVGKPNGPLRRNSFENSLIPDVGRGTGEVRRPPPSGAPAPRGGRKRPGPDRRGYCAPWMFEDAG